MKRGTGLFAVARDAFLMVGERKGASWSVGVLFLESWEDGGEVVFRCDRTGSGGVPFTLAGFDRVRLVPVVATEEILLPVDRGGSSS